MGFFFCKEGPKVYLPFVVFNLSYPSFFTFWNPTAKAYAFQSMLIRMFAIGSVLAVSGLSKIFKSVIRFITINMINHFCWHKTCYVEPNKTMRRIKLPINLKIDVSFMVQASRFFANLNFASRLIPIQITRNGVVPEDGCECVVIKHTQTLPGLESNCNSN